MSWTYLHDPDEREAFKASRPGLRRDLEGRPAHDLTPDSPDPELRAECARRRTHRSFAPEPVPMEALSRLVGCLRQVAAEPEPRFLYPSAGGLYPVQTYLHLRPGRVETLPPGAYSYHPVDHALTALATGVDIDPGVHVPLINRPVYERAAFSIFLVAELAAIAPIYGEDSPAFAALECGYMSQLLMLHAPDCGLGLCPIGSLEAEPVRSLLGLGESRLLIHSHLGGLLPVGGEAGREERR